MKKLHPAPSPILPSTPALYLVDKPTGVTSHDVVAWFRRATGVRKIGHAGTLDPLATGLLIILVGRDYTRRQAEFLKQDKSYECEFVLGQETDSYDSDGIVTARADWERVRQIDQDAIERALDGFRGKSMQQVPAYSAVKRAGKKLYEHARAGTLDLSTLPEREVHIRALYLHSFVRDEALQLSRVRIVIECSSGTYIRSLAHDIGRALQVGATVTALRRTAIGQHSLASALLCPLYR